MKLFLPALVTALLLFPGNSFAQRYNDDLYHGHYDHFFFGRQPSSRIESMGKEFSSAIGEANSYFYNPAGMGSLSGLTVTGTHASPYYSLSKASNNYFSVAYKIQNYGVIGISRDYFTWGEEIPLTTPIQPMGTGESFTPHTKIYRLTLAAEPIKQLYGGINLNFFSENFPDINSSAFMLDAGVIKSFKIDEGRKYSHSINTGVSAFNILSSSVSYEGFDDVKIALPVTLRLGGSYTFSFNEPWLIYNLKGYEVSAHVDYRNVTNAAYLQTVSTGAEVVLMEMLSLRAGYYSQDIDNNCANCKERLSSFTYGIGLNIPIRRLSNSATGLEFKFDMTNLEQPSPLDNNKAQSGELFKGFDNFQVYTFKLNWQF